VSKKKPVSGQSETSQAQGEALQLGCERLSAWRCHLNCLSLLDCPSVSFLCSLIMILSPLAFSSKGTTYLVGLCIRWHNQLQDAKGCSLFVVAILNLRRYCCGLCPPNAWADGFRSPTMIRSYIIQVPGMDLPCSGLDGQPRTSTPTARANSSTQRT